MPVLDSPCVDGSGTFADRKNYDGDGVICIVFLCLGDRSDSDGPDFVFEIGGPCYLPRDFLAFATNLVEGLVIGWSWGDENGVCHEADVARVDEGGRLDVGECDEPGRVGGIDEIAEINV